MEAAHSRLLEGVCVVPDGSEGHGPCQLTDSSAQGAFSHNGICSMGFGLEHQIKSTSGVGVNGDSGVPRRLSDQMISISSAGEQLPRKQDRAQPKSAEQSPQRKSLSQGHTRSLTAGLPQANGLSSPRL